MIISAMLGENECNGSLPSFWKSRDKMSGCYECKTNCVFDIIRSFALKCPYVYAYFVKYNSIYFFFSLGFLTYCAVSGRKSDIVGVIENLLLKFS